MRIGKIRPKRDRLPMAIRGLLEFSLRVKCASKVNVCLGKFGIELYRPLAARHRFVEFSAFTQQMPEIRIRLGIVRIQLHGPANMRDPFLALAALKQRDAKHVNRRRKIPVIRQNLPVNSLRLAKSSGSMVRDRDVHRLCKRKLLIGLHERHSTVFPPFTEIFCPVMNAPASDARKTTVLPTSSGKPNLPSGVCEAYSFFT